MPGGTAVFHDALSDALDVYAGAQRQGVACDGVALGGITAVGAFGSIPLIGGDLEGTQQLLALLLAFRHALDDDVQGFLRNALAFTEQQADLTAGQIALRIENIAVVAGDVSPVGHGLDIAHGPVADAAVVGKGRTSCGGTHLIGVGQDHGRLFTGNGIVDTEVSVSQPLHHTGLDAVEDRGGVPLSVCHIPEGVGGAGGETQDLVQDRREFAAGQSVFRPEGPVFVTADVTLFGTVQNFIIVIPVAVHIGKALGRGAGRGKCGKHQCEGQDQGGYCFFQHILASLMGILRGSFPYDKECPIPRW